MLVARRTNEVLRPVLHRIKLVAHLAQIQRLHRARLLQHPGALVQRLTSLLKCQITRSGALRDGRSEGAPGELDCVPQLLLLVAPPGRDCRLEEAVDALAGALLALKLLLVDLVVLSLPSLFRLLG